MTGSQLAVPWIYTFHFFTSTTKFCGVARGHTLSNFVSTNTPMLQYVKKKIVQQLWQAYQKKLPEVSAIQKALLTCYNDRLAWDHFAVIDLPGPQSGVQVLTELFLFLDYVVKGEDYLINKQNHFVWLADSLSETQRVDKALPQVVVADFRREALAPAVRKIVDYYASFSKPVKAQYLRCLKERIFHQDRAAVLALIAYVVHYLNRRDWPLPTLKEFAIVKESNELLAWVLVMGRQVNHFAWAVHTSNQFVDLESFNYFVTETLAINLNKRGGVLRGQAAQGIQQSATQPVQKIITLTDGIVFLPDRFIEFVWRYPIHADYVETQKLRLWKHYFNGFIADNADSVVESLYLN